MRLSENPVFNRLTRNARWPSVRACLWLSFGLGLAATAGMMVAIIVAPTQGVSIVISLVGLAAALVTLVSPAIVGVTAWIVTTRYLASQEYQLMRLTALEPRVIVRGHVTVALFRTRGLLAVMVALLPVVVLGFFNTIILDSAHVYTGGLGQCSGPGRWMGPFYVLHHNGCMFAYKPLYAIATLIVTTLILAIWFLNLSAAAIGVGLVLRLRNAVWAAAGGPLVLTLMLCATVPMLSFFEVVLRTLIYPYYPGFPHISIIVIHVAWVPVIPLYYCAGWLFARRAERWV